MPLINTGTESNRGAVGASPPSGGAPVNPSAWQRLTAACSSIADSFLRDTDRLCGNFFDRNPPGHSASAASFHVASNPVVSRVHVKMLVSDKVVKKITKRRITTARLRMAGPEFKSSMVSFQKKLQKSLPTVVEVDEYTRTRAPSPVREAAQAACNSNPANSFSDKQLDVESLAAQFNAMDDFDFSVKPNPLSSAAQSSHAGHSPDSVKPIEHRRTARSQRIVDHVPSSFPATKQQMLINFRGKIIAHNVKTARLLNVHNEMALSKFLAVLKQYVSDKGVASLDAMTPSQTYHLFELFCQELKVSPFKEGYGQI